jgi:hypothetical protein
VTAAEDIRAKVAPNLGSPPHGLASAWGR